MFIKLTFMMDYADLVLLLFAQFLRFLIWSLTLTNFLKSTMDLITSKGTKMTLKILRFCIIGGGCFFVAYAVYMICQEQVSDKDVLSCKTLEFITQSTFNMVLVGIFLGFAWKTTKMINLQIAASA